MRRPSCMSICVPREEPLILDQVYFVSFFARNSFLGEDSNKFPLLLREAPAEEDLVMLQIISRKYLLELLRSDLPFSTRGKLCLGMRIWRIDLRRRVQFVVLWVVDVVAVVGLLRVAAELDRLRDWSLHFLDLDLLHLCLIKGLEVVGVGLVLLLEEFELVLSHEGLLWYARVHVVYQRS